MTPEMLVPASSDAEIRAFLRPLLKAGTPPTYKAMRATLGGGFSRLARIKKQVERELAGDVAVGEPADEQVGATELVATFEGLFDRQSKAIEEWERRALARFEAVAAAGFPTTTKAKGVAEATSAQADRLEAVERRLLAIVDKLQAMTKAPAVTPARTSVVAGALEDVPPAWARQAAAAATAALDGRLQSVEETMRDAAAGGRAAFDLAAEMAREVAADASLQLQVARSTLTKAVREEFASQERSNAFAKVDQSLAALRAQVSAEFSTAASLAERRAVAFRDVVLGITEIEMAQVELQEVLGTAILDRVSRRSHRVRHRRVDNAPPPRSNSRQ